MRRSDFLRIARTMAANLKQVTPKDTGNLAYNATRYEPLSAQAVRIYVNTRGDHKSESRDGIAPYFVYVNYMKSRKRTDRNGNVVIKPNRNYHYWDDAIDAQVKEIARIVGGDVKKEGAPDA